MEEFGIYLSKLRENSGFKSQRQLAIAAGVAPATLSRVESGSQEPTPSTLKKLARHLKDVTYEDLLNAAGYLDHNGQKELIKQDEHDDSLLEIHELAEQYGFEDMGFFDIEEWKNLSSQDIKMIEEHFKVIVKLAKERNKDKDNSEGGD
ncbi:helix-turn-helix domain-containing protein [Cytobacillus firmus]|uniref:helix-turn-helix domain-containing protein n=1 Tax=Cytobacillus firmus TaxID=1399 RepID=UPI00369109AC